MTEKPLIEINALVKAFEQPDGSPLLVLDGIDLTVEKNTLTTLIGPSGCGKSTFLNILTGLEAPTGGEILFHPEGKEKVEFGYVFQAARLLPWMRVIDNVRFVHDDGRSLAETERLARRTGAAVAIGHPREATLRALGRWLAGVEARGFQLVPLSAVVKGGRASG